MKRLGNPWFLLVASVIAMAAYAYDASLVAMVVIGSPFFVIVVGVAMVARYGNPAAAAAAPQPGPRGQQVIDRTYMPVLIGGFAYLIWSVVTATGPMGWFDAIQARQGGTYSPKLSLLGGMCYLLLLVMAWITLVGKVLMLTEFGRSKTSAESTAPRRKQMDAKRQVLYSGIGLFIGIWVVGFGIYGHYTVRHQREMQASYAPVDVAAPVGAAAQLEFVALRGKRHPGGSLTFRAKYSTGGTDYTPLVASAVRDRTVPVHWVLQSSGPLPDLSQVVRGHAIGASMSRPMQEAFSRMGVRLADDVVLVSYVAASRDGVVAEGDDYWPVFLIVTSVISGFTALFYFVAWRRHPTAQIKGVAAVSPPTSS